jgi:LPXTG-motif cell wall-anchored protein
MGNGIRYAIFWNPQYRYEHLLIAGLGLLLSVPCGIYLRRKRREIQELK